MKARFTVLGIVLAMSLFAALAGVGPASAAAPQGDSGGGITIAIGERKIVTVPNSDPTDPSKVFFLVYEAKRTAMRLLSPQSGQISPLTLYTWTDVCSQSGTNVFGQVLWTHTQNNNVTWDDSVNNVELNWADLSGTGTSYPGWQLDSTSGPTANPGVGVWTNDLYVTSDANFSLRLNGNVLQTASSGITYYNDGSVGSCSYR